MLIKKVFKTITVMILLFILLTSFAMADDSKKAVLIVINEVNFNDLYKMESVQELIENGSIALMNNRTSTRANTYKAYTTIGTGVRAEASSDSTNCLNLDDESKSIYMRRTGFNVNDEGIVNSDIAKLIRLNMNGEYGAIPGALGQSLHDAGIKTAAIGNSDIKDLNIRLAPLIAMDNKGYVDYGDVSKSTLVMDDHYPFGIKNNYDVLLETFKNVYNKSGLVVIDIGDIGRLERYKDNLTDEMYLFQKAKILKDMDGYMASLMKEINITNTRIILITPYPSSADIKIGNTLTPVIAYGDGIEKGVLTSGTTRRTGIIGNVDIAPSIVEYLKTSTHVMTGKPFHTVSLDHQFEYLMELNQRVISTSTNRYPVLSTFAIFEILISILSLFIILIGEKFNKNAIHYFKNVLLSTMTVPFVLLILPMFHINNLFMSYLFLIGITFIITYIAKKLSKKKLDSILILSFITTFALLLDIATGGNLIKNSLLGYDPIIGARYYGIGNEYMGVLIGSTLVFATAILDRFNIGKSWSILIFMITILVMGYPKLGANVGGTITAVAAFTFTILRILKIKIKTKQLTLIGVFIVLVIGSMGFIDMKLLGSQSHLAGAINQIMQGGPSVILLIIKRKIAMNLKLIGVTIWSKVLISAIIIIGTLFYRPVGTIYKLTKLYPNLAMGWSGIVAACIVGFVVNDSGVVASATGIIFLVMSMLYLTFYIPKDND